MLRKIRAKLGLSTIDHAFFDTVREIPWFSRCGNPPTFDIPLPTQPLPGWNEAVASMCSTHWENTTLDARNALSVFLHKNFNRKFQLWNEIAEVAKRCCVEPLSAGVWRQFAQSHDLEDAFVHAVQGDVLAAIMEHEYRDCPGAPRFFLHLLDVYRRGHIPCGWAGTWPTGKLLVY